MKRTWEMITLALGICAVTASVSMAQGYGTSARVPRRLAPSQRPMVSPYLNLIQFENSVDDSVPVYQTLVRPFVDQRRLNQLQANQVFQLQQQVARGASRTGQGDSLRETGHMTLYQNMSHFYPSMQRR